MNERRTEQDHPVKTLFHELERFRYPSGVVGTWCLVQGPEFFPGGCGLWNARLGKPWPLLKPGCVIVLGHNLDSIDSYRRNLKTGGIMRGPTWSNLRKLLVAAEIPLDEAFLTNFFMGVGPEQVGEFPGAADQKFVDDCLEFLSYTIRLLKPKSLIVLGGYTRKYLSSLSQRLKQWAGISKFTQLDDEGCALIRGVATSGAPEFTVANIVHPSGAKMGNNQEKRRYKGWVGFDAEVALLQDAMAMSGNQAAKFSCHPNGENAPPKPYAELSATLSNRFARKGTVGLSRVSDINTWRMNTDRDARTDRPTCDIWYEHGMALAGDFAGHELEHGEVFRKLAKGDQVFMHHSGLGIVGFGDVLEGWDGKVYQGDERMLYVKEIYEYRVRVAWREDCDCRHYAVSISGRLPYMGTYSMINPNKWRIDDVVRQLQLHAETSGHL